MGVEDFQNSRETPELNSLAREAAIRVCNGLSLCTLATLNDHGLPHVNTAYFVWDSETDRLFILSETATAHSQNLRNRNNVAVNVFEVTDDWSDDIVGVQMTGIATELGLGDSDEALVLYREKFKSAQEALSDGLVGDFKDSRFVEICLDSYKVIDTKLFGDEIYVELTRDNG